MADEEKRSGISERLRFAAAVVVVALFAAAFATAFRASLNAALGTLYGSTNIVSTLHRLPAWLKIAVPCIGGVAAGVAAKLATARGANQGVGDVMEAVVLGNTHLSMRVTLFKSLGSWLAIATGGSIGREGPIIQFGGSAGTLATRWFHLDQRRARVLIAAGTAAGFGAAYNTPFAAVLFVLEIVTGIVALDVVLPVIASTVFATAFTRAVSGGGPIYGQRAFDMASQLELLAHAVLGLLAALVAQAFMALLSRGEAWFARMKVSQPWRAGLGGACVGLIALGMPEVAGNGYEPLNALLDGRLAFWMLGVLLVAKATATTASVSSGSPGGVFTPTLLIGATLGACFWHVLHTFGFSHLGTQGGYALVAMAAVTAATTHAPLMAAVLVFELSGDYAIVLPLLLATTIATLLSRSLRPDSIYTAELLRRGVRWELTLEGRKVDRK